jgi:hypothetical protein
MGAAHGQKRFLQISDFQRAMPYPFSYEHYAALVDEILFVFELEFDFARQIIRVFRITSVPAHDLIKIRHVRIQ